MNENLVADMAPAAVEPDLANTQAETRERYTVEFGQRNSDNALVFHFYPPLDESGSIGEWPVGSDMDKRLERVLPRFFNTSNLTAGYEDEYDSFFIIVGGLAAPDLRLLSAQFFDALDEDPVSS